jgi:hypothetical protein
MSLLALDCMRATTLFLMGASVRSTRFHIYAYHLYPLFMLFSLYVVASPSLYDTLVKFKLSACSTVLHSSSRLKCGLVNASVIKVILQGFSASTQSRLERKDIRYARNSTIGSTDEVMRTAPDAPADNWITLFDPCLTQT